jgi:hypothetical protein
LEQNIWSNNERKPRKKLNVNVARKKHAPISRNNKRRPLPLLPPSPLQLPRLLRAWKSPPPKLSRLPNSVREGASVPAAVPDCVLDPLVFVPDLPFLLLTLHPTMARAPPPIDHL